ncbi:MAG: hypothetical protein JWN14_753 [Chthonomonadales bacterium]|nr:hypothetical protein [Chthonomonadales bacterium]
MAQIHMNGDEVAELGEELYRQKIRGEVEIPENIGKMVIIDVETGEYAVDEIGLISARHLYANHPDAELYGIRIGYKAAEALGGVLERSTP